MKRIPATNRFTVCLLAVATMGALECAGPRRLAAATPAETPGASAQTASISGRVKNAASGQYLGKVRVAVRGTDNVTYTDDFGSFRLVDVPPGPVVLDVFYTDMDPLAVTLSAARGGDHTQDVALTNAARYGRRAVW